MIEFPASRASRLHGKKLSTGFLFLVLCVACTNCFVEETVRSNPNELPSGARIPMDSGGSTARTKTVELFKRQCSSCHGDDGKGRSSARNRLNIPDFTNSKWQRSRTDTQLLLGIFDGRGTEMPSFAERITEADAQELVAFVRSLNSSGPKPDDRPTDDFERRFHELQKELDELRKQFRELASPPKH